MSTRQTKLEGSAIREGEHSPTHHSRKHRSIETGRVHECAVGVLDRGANLERLSNCRPLIQAEKVLLHLAQQCGQVLPLEEFFGLCEHDHSADDTCSVTAEAKQVR